MCFTVRPSQSQNVVLTLADKGCGYACSCIAITIDFFQTQPWGRSGALIDLLIHMDGERIPPVLRPRILGFTKVPLFQINKKQAVFNHFLLLVKK